MKYDSNTYSNLEEFVKTIKDVGEFSIDVQDGLGTPPVLEVLRALDNASSFDIETQDTLSKYCVKGKRVMLYYDGNPIGAFTLNGMEDSWDAFDVFKKYPLALQFVFNVCTANVIKNSIPPQKSTVLSPAAGVQRL